MSSGKFGLGLFLDLEHIEASASSSFGAMQDEIIFHWNAMEPNIGNWIFGRKNFSITVGK